MITAAPHQSRSAVICPTFNINMSGCHGEVGEEAHSCPLSFLSLSLSGTSTITHNTVLYTRATQSLLTIHVNQILNSVDPKLPKCPGSDIILSHLLPQWKSLFLLTWPELTPSRAFHSLGFVHTNADTFKDVFYVISFHSLQRNLFFFRQHLVQTWSVPLLGFSAGWSFVLSPPTFSVILYLVFWIRPITQYRCNQ